MLSGIVRAVGITALFVLAVWGIGEAAGFEINLGLTLIASVGLTVLLNFVVGGYRRVTNN